MAGSGQVLGLQRPVGGTYLRGPAFRELEAAVTLFRESTHVDDVGRALLTQIGELAQVGGWIASDGGLLEQAEQAYRLGASSAAPDNRLPARQHRP